MNWEKLLCTKRVENLDGCGTVKKESQFKEPRSPFEKDFDQIIFSYPFRRLQDKTQVIPFPKFDFVHTRLTHSLEVASVGRSLGKMTANLIFEEISKEFVKKNNLCKSDIGALVAAACLAHDIGNPPFGHSGEDAISHYFIYQDDNFIPFCLPDDNIKDDGEELHFIVDVIDADGTVTKDIPHSRNKFINLEECKRWKDLTNFEGNANGFRIMTTNCERGINPTIALLGTFTKYPRESYLFKDPYKNLPKSKIPKSQTKYGFFQGEKNIFKNVANELGLIAINDIDKFDTAFKRHPLAFIMEAADDIANGMIDFEDGCKLLLIDFDKHYGEITLRKKRNQKEVTKIESSPKQILINIAELDNSFDINHMESLSDFKQSISYLRGKVINVLTHEVFAVFKDNYDDIMTGNFDKDLISCISNDVININLFKMQTLVRKFVYNYKPVLESEAAGFDVMEKLIEDFAIFSMICYSCNDTETDRDLKYKSLIPDEYLPENEKEMENLTQEEKYQRVIKILDYISGMTDNFAISLYRNIKGIQMPE